MMILKRKKRSEERKGERRKPEEVKPRTDRKDKEQRKGIKR